MRALLLSTLVAAALLPAQRSRDLEVRDLFVLDYFLVFPREEPVAWLDAERYLVFDAGAVGAQGPNAWQAVTARDGKRTPLLPRARLAAGLQAIGVDPAQVAAELDERSAYTWAADHRQLVCRLGGDLFAVTLADAKVVRLTATPGMEELPGFAPDGRHVAYVLDHDLWVVPSAGGEARRLTTGGTPRLLHGKLDWVYQEEVYGRDHWQAWWWSPDSARIALLRIDQSPVQEFTLVHDVPAVPEVERTLYPKTGDPNPIAAVGAVDIAGGEPRWFDLSDYAGQETLIVRVNWSPDGGRVCFQVQDREQRWLDLLSGDPTTGVVRRMLREDSDCWVEPGAEPQWIGQDRGFLWLSERDGYRHIYRFDAAGEMAGRLTEGTWEVKAIVAVDADAGRVWFTADRADVKGVQLFAVTLDGGEPTQITAGGGTHEVTMAPGNGAFLSTWSSATRPEAITLHAADGQVLRKVAVPRVDYLAPFRLPEPEFVQVPARDGFVMEAMLIKPRGWEAGRRYPVLQNLYAGPHAPRVRDRWGHRDLLWHHMLAQQGYLVFLCDNRSASGKGRVAHKACWRNLGVSELQDLEDAAEWLVQQGLADADRMGLWGWSYGGYQTLYNLTHSKRWRLGIAVNAVTDWRLYDTIYTERYHGLPGPNAAAYRRSSVIEAAADLHGELLLVAAALDDNVHMQNSLQFLHALQMAQKQCRFMVYPRVRHGIETLEQQMHLFTMMTAFVKEKL